METLKVSTKSNPNSVAGAVAGAVRQAGAVEIQIVGAGALNQAIKAVAIARGYVTASGIDLVCVPTFADILIDGERRTAIRLTVEDRRGRLAEATEGGRARVAEEADEAPLTVPAERAAPAVAVSMPTSAPAPVNEADAAQPVNPALAAASVAGPSAAGLGITG